MFKLHYDKKKKCLIGVYHGMYSLEILRACAAKIQYATETYACQRFALDMRQADMDAALVNFEDCYTVLIEAGLDESWKKAVLLTSDSFASIPEEQKLAEHSDMNLYSDVSEAAQWLFA